MAGALASPAPKLQHAPGRAVTHLTLPPTTTTRPSDRLWPASARCRGIVVGLVNAGDRHRPTWGWGRAWPDSKVNSNT